MSSPTNQIAVDRYVEIKREITKLEKELDEIKESVFKFVDTKGGELDDERFVLRCQKRPKYKFSGEYDKKNQELKDLKKAEIENGTATIDSYSEFVTVKIKDA